MDKLQSRKIESQARACIEALKNSIKACLIDGYPADRALRAFFKQNRKFGSRDRRLIREAIFTVWRWYGWGRYSLPDYLRLREAPGILGKKYDKDAGQNFPKTNILGKPDAASLLLFAEILEHKELTPCAAVWADLSDTALAVVEDIVKISERNRRANEMLRVLWDTKASETVKLPPSVQAHDLLPAWAVERLSVPFPTDHQETVGWLQKRPPVWIRMQILDGAELAASLREQKIVVSVHNRLSDAANLGHPGKSLYGLPEFGRGEFEIQDIASQCIGHACSPHPGERWWDACAGAGGKTLQLATLMRGNGKILATDIRKAKLDELRKRARRQKSGVTIASQRWRGDSPLKHEDEFDGVLVDAPCSGSGTWRRHPDAPWRTSTGDIEKFAKIQNRILCNAAKGVKPGGVLIYATCSIFPHENQAVIEHFVAHNTKFELEPFTNPLTGETAQGILQIWPWDADCDAVFIARFRKER